MINKRCVHESWFELNCSVSCFVSIASDPINFLNIKTKISERHRNCFPSKRFLIIPFEELRVALHDCFIGNQCPFIFGNLYYGVPVSSFCLLTFINLGKYKKKTTCHNFSNNIFLDNFGPKYKSQFLCQFNRNKN